MFRMMPEARRCPTGTPAVLNTMDVIRRIAGLGGAFHSSLGTLSLADLSRRGRGDMQRSPPWSLRGISGPDGGKGGLRPPKSKLHLGGGGRTRPGKGRIRRPGWAGRLGEIGGHKNDSGHLGQDRNSAGQPPNRRRWSSSGAQEVVSVVVDSSIFLAQVSLITGQQASGLVQDLFPLPSAKVDLQKPP